MKRHICRFIKRSEGVAYLEFALALPLLLTLFLGAAELSRYVLINQKVGKISMNISDIVSQLEDATSDELNLTMLAAGELMKPYDFPTDGYVIISSVSKEESVDASIDWQHAGGGNNIQNSVIGVAAGTATLPAGFVLSDGDHVIITEVFFTYRPILDIAGNIVEISSVYRYSIFKPRLGELRTLG